MATANKHLASWDASKQQTYRQKNPDKVLTFHFVLDASPSMAGNDATNLRKAYAMYLAWLQQHADPMSLVEMAVFSTELTRHPITALGLCKPLTGQDYDPMDGNGTALYRAIGEVCTTVSGEGQHVLVIFTDGFDNTSGDVGWTNGQVYMLLQTLQQDQQWLCVFLGAFRDALTVGISLGFQPGNCLEFTTDKIPEAFQRLTGATEKYLAAGPQERRLLTRGGVF